MNDDKSSGERVHLEWYLLREGADVSDRRRLGTKIADDVFINWTRRQNEIASA